MLNKDEKVKFRRRRIFDTVASEFSYAASLEIIAVDSAKADPVQCVRRMVYVYEQQKKKISVEVVDLDGDMEMQIDVDAAKEAAVSSAEDSAAARLREWFSSVNANQVPMDESLREVVQTV